MSNQSSNDEFNDLPSSPEDYPKLKCPKYFNPRKFLKKEPSPVVDSSSTPCDNTPAQGDSEKKDSTVPEKPPEEDMKNSTSSPEYEEACCAKSTCVTPKSSYHEIRPRFLLSQLRKKSDGRKTKRNFGLTLFTSMRSRSNVCKMTAESESSYSESSDSESD